MENGVTLPRQFIEAVRLKEEWLMLAHIRTQASPGGLECKGKFVTFVHRLIRTDFCVRAQESPKSKVFPSVTFC